MRKRKEKERKLARLILGGLLATSGVLFAPGTVSAEITTTGTAPDDLATQTTNNILDTSGRSYWIKNTEKVWTFTGGTYDQTAIGTGNNGIVASNGTGGSGFTLNIKGGTWKDSASDFWILVGAENSDPSVDATNNQINISSGNFANAGKIQGVLMWGTADGSISGNQVNLTGGTWNVDSLEIAAGYDRTTAGVEVKENTVTISVGDDVTLTNASVYGGYSQNGGNVSGNTVNISSGTIKGTVYGGQSNGGAANDNIVRITGGTVDGTIYGGMGNTEASGNTVTISGDAIISEDTWIYGGTGAPIAQNNTVNILNKISIKGLYGGIGSGTGDGNTLNVAAKGVTVGSDGINGFQNLNFYLPTNMSKTDTMLTVSGTAEVDGAKVGVMAQGKLANLAKDDKVTLLHANTLNGTVSQTTEIDVPESIAKVNTYEFNVTSDANNIYATITKAPEEGGGEGGGGSKNAETRENTKSVVETKAATTTFVNAGADMLASQGFSEAANAVAMEMAESTKNGGKGSPIVSSFTPFAAFGGSSMRAESGSYVDTRGFGLNIGFARELSNAQGKLLFGPVVEYGGGNYDSYLDNGVHGEGGSHYFGVGIMARQVNRDGFYYEGSVRGGRVTSDYKGTFNLQNVNYDSSSNYWAAHLGIGKAFAVGGSNTLDGYVKYFYSHQAGDSVTMHTTAGADEDWNFDSVDSHRIRIGARLTHKVNDKNSLYGGLAYQYEFGGEATAHYNGGSTPSPSVKGSSGMLELGWQVKPGEGPLTLDLGVTGWAGKQRGGSVQLGATWSF